MYHTVRHYIEHEQLLSEGATVIVGLSGGCDSMVLLHVLHRMGYRCIAAHCNFHLRGEESDHDEQFVRNFCQEQDIPLAMTHFETIAYAQEHQLSIELAARELRYEWFESLYLDYQAEAIVVGHHADDQAETLLMHLVRGSGLNGLCGMLPKNGHIVRPLLCVSREAIEQYAQQEHLRYVTDSTNSDTQYRRNYFRHEVIPLLEKLNPQIISTLSRTCQHLQGYQQFIQAETTRLREKCLVKEGNTDYIDLQQLCRHESWETWLYELLTPYGLQGDQVEQLTRSIHAQHSGKQYMSASHRCLLDRTKLILQPLVSKTEVVPTLLQHTFPRKDMGAFPLADAPTVCIDADKVKGTLHLRHWQEGDTFRPIGMKGNKKLSDFFTDQKLSVFEKEEVWIVCDDEHIVWVAGHRMDDRYKITADSRTILELTLQKDTTL